MDLDVERAPFPWKHILLYTLEFGFIINIIFLDIFITKIIFFAPVKNQAASVERIEKTVYITITPTPEQQTATVNSLQPPVNSVQQTSLIPAAKEYFIPFGSGQSSSSDWTDVPGVEAYVDSRNYLKIKTITFEATVHIPNATQSVQIRLFDTTDEHPVWYSDLNFPGTGTQILTSQPITLDSGNKLYTVQMKTQLQAPAILDQARLHITLQ